MSNHHDSLQTGPDTYMSSPMSDRPDRTGLPPIGGVQVRSGLRGPDTGDVGSDESVESIVRFLRHLHSEAEGYLAIWSAFPGETEVRHRWSLKCPPDETSLREVVETSIRVNRWGEMIYFGVNPRSISPGNSNLVTSRVALVAITEPGNVDLGYSRAVRLIEGGIWESAVLWYGWGLARLYRLDEMVAADERSYRISDQLCRVLDSEYGQDAEIGLLLPGTINWGVSSDPRECRIMSASTDERVSLVQMSRVTRKIEYRESEWFLRPERLRRPDVTTRELMEFTWSGEWRLYTEPPKEFYRSERKGEQS